MPLCAFKNCTNNQRNSKISEGISFFRFPTDPFRCAEWISIVAQERGEDFYKPCKTSTICSIHFYDFDITINSKRRRLLKTAVPKLQIYVNPKKAVCANFEDDVSNQATSPRDHNQDSTEMSIIPQTSEVSLNSSDASISDLIPLRETPRKMFLKKNLAIYRNIIVAKSKKIRNLNKVNKRLKQKNIILKNMIKRVQKKKQGMF